MKNPPTVKVHKYYELDVVKSIAVKVHKYYELDVVKVLQ